MFTVCEKTESFIASGDLSLCLGRVAQLHSGVNFVCELAGAGQNFGVLLTAPKDKEHASVVIAGVTMVRVGAAVNADDYLTSAASGWAITATVAAAHQKYFGRALTNAASGMLAAVLVERGYLPNSIA